MRIIIVLMIGVLTCGEHDIIYAFPKDVAYFHQTYENQPERFKLWFQGQLCDLNVLYNNLPNTVYAKIIKGVYHCAPTAGAMVLDYWAKNGFPDLRNASGVDGDLGNIQTTPRNTETEMIGNLGYYMDTNDLRPNMYENDSRNFHYATKFSRSHISKGISDYITSRNNTYQFKSTPSSTNIRNISMIELEFERPVIVTGTRNGHHSWAGVGYSYTSDYILVHDPDNEGSQDIQIPWNNIQHVVTVIPKGYDDTKTLSNPKWSIDIDPYGRSRRLMYNYPNNVVRDEMYDWAGYVQYTPEGQNSVAGWLYDTLIFPNAEWVDEDIGGSGYLTKDGNMDQIGNVRGIVSQVSNDDLRITIQSWIDDWWFYPSPQQERRRKYVLKQTYIFENKSSNNNLTDLKYIQYMDPDIDGDDYGYPVRHGLLFTAEPGCRASEMWILNTPNQARGYSLACRDFPQPDPFYGRDEGWGVGLYSDIKEAIENNGLSTIISPADAYYKGDAAAALRWSIGSLASGKKEDIELGLYVIPEPSTMLLLGSGLVGLAGRYGIIRRRKREVK